MINSLIFYEQCPNGHTLCSSCKARVRTGCPTCRHELGNIRCLALEKVAESLELPCRYQIWGCQDIFPYYSKLKHEKNCNYRPYNCPYAGAECSVTGDIPLLVRHLKNDHKVDMHDGSTFNHRYVKANALEIENATWMLTVRPLISSSPLILTSLNCKSWLASLCRCQLSCIRRYFFQKFHFHFAL